MKGRWARVLKFPLIRIILGSVFVVMPAIVLQRVIHTLPIPLASVKILSALASAVGALLGYRVYVQRIERRPLTEFAGRGALWELGGGLATGAVLFTASIGALALLGVYRVTGTAPAAAMVSPLAAAVAAGILEELLFRGVVFRIVEAAIGSWMALAISAALFGLIHLVNPHATLLGALSIIFEAGVLLAAAYMVTRRLWLPIGIHVAWNFTQGGIFGVAVSGGAATGVLHGVLSGPTWLSGGTYGAEASAVAVLVCSTAAIGFLTMAIRRRRIAPAPWQRQHIGRPSTEPGLPME